MPDVSNQRILDELRHVRANTVLIMQKLHRMDKEDGDIMKTLDEILGAQDTALANYTQETEVDRAIAAAFTADRQTIVDLRAQVAAAGNDPAKIAQIGANMDAILAAQDVDSKVKAVLDNTPAAVA